MEKLFSIIVPCYNVEKLIDDCMNSLINQTIGIDKLEIILVDDCSTDGTAEKLLTYEKQYEENVIIILAEKNGRQGTARNIGLAYASGKYISFVDSDDFVNYRMYEVLFDIVNKEDVDVVQFRYTPARSIEDCSKLISEDEVVSNIKFYNYEENRKKYLLNSNILNESCTQKIYRRDLIDKIGCRFAEGMAYEEPLFTYPIKFGANRVCVLEYPLYYYRFNNEGTTASYMNNPETILDHLNVQLKLREFMLNSNLSKEYEDELNLYFVHAFYVEPFYFFKGRGWSLPVALWKYMRNIVLDTCPNILDNHYLDDPSLYEEKKLIELLKVDEKDDSMHGILETIALEI